MLSAKSRIESNRKRLATHTNLLRALFLVVPKEINTDSKFPFVPDEEGLVTIQDETLIISKLSYAKEPMQTNGE